MPMKVINKENNKSKPIKKFLSLILFIITFFIFTNVKDLILKILLQKRKNKTINKVKKKNSWYPCGRSNLAIGPLPNTPCI